MNVAELPYARKVGYNAAPASAEWGDGDQPDADRTGRIGMAKPRGQNAAKSKAGGGRKSATSGRLEEMSNSTAQIVKDAAALLDQELAAGIVAANQVQRRFRDEGRVDPKDFNVALQRFQANAHEVIRLLNERLDDMRSNENFATVRSLMDRSHDVVDLAVELVNSSAEIADRLANSPLVKKETGRRAGRKR
jgi:hypothetical protein